MVECGMVGKSVKDFCSELLGATLHSAVRRNAVSPVGAGGKYNEYRHNLPKISFKSMSEGSLDAASEGELGEGG
jgi:hypothetical protein